MQELLPVETSQIGITKICIYHMSHILTKYRLTQHMFNFTVLGLQNHATYIFHVKLYIS